MFRSTRPLFRSWLRLCAVLVACLTACTLLMFTHHAWAGSSETAEEQARRAAEIYKTTMSPFCPGRTVDACPSPNATAWRDDIRRWVSEGVNTEEIRRRLDARTDQDLTGAPSTALDSVLPLGATVLSLVLLGFLLRLLVKPTNPATSSGRETLATKDQSNTAVDEKASERELEDRLERELERLDD